MGKDGRAWRKLVKKLQRSRRRKLKAGVDPSIAKDSPSGLDLADADKVDLSSESDVIDNLQHDNDEAAYWEREKQAQLQFQKKQANSKRKRAKQEKEREKKRAEREANEEKQRILEEERKVREEIARVQQEEKLNELLEFLSGDLENPPQKYLMPDILDSDAREPCLYYSKTGACRFYDRCKQAHLQPTLSCTILIQNFFSYFYIQQGLSRASYETDLTLEYEETDLYKEFLKFHNDVLPEFQSIGKVVQFKVCNNFEPHMRGNVYVQYDTIKESVQAYRVFNARFYGGKQLTVQFVRISSWKGAICGKYCRKRCDKGKTCNYIHPFRNSTKEFIDADNDWPEPEPPRRKERHRGRSERDDENPRTSSDSLRNSEADSERSGSTSPVCSTASDDGKSTPEPPPTPVEHCTTSGKEKEKAGKSKSSESNRSGRRRRSKSSDSEKRNRSSSSRSEKSQSRMSYHHRRTSSDEDSREPISKRRREDSHDEPNERRSRYHRHSDHNSRRRHDHSRPKSKDRNEQRRSDSSHNLTTSSSGSRSRHESTRHKERRKSDRDRDREHHHRSDRTKRR